LLYWTAEEDKCDALMEFPYHRELVEQAGRRFDDVVNKICARNFQVLNVPESKICKECDLKHYCIQDGLLIDKAAVIG